MKKQSAHTDYRPVVNVVVDSIVVVDDGTSVTVTDFIAKPVHAKQASKMYTSKHF